MKFLPYKISIVINFTKCLICYSYLAYFFSACENFVEIDPPNSQIVSSTAYRDDATAISAISGIYSEMAKPGAGFTNGSTSILAGLSADELVPLAGAPTVVFFTNSLVPTNSDIQSSLWGSAYKHIFQANAVLEGLAKSSTLTDLVRNQLEGEALFLRAFCHFYLVNLFGDVPLVTSTDYRVNSTAFRVSQSQIYKQVIADLVRAKAKLPPDYASYDNERLRPNKYAAIALLARTYLFTSDWTNAEIEATELINNETVYSLKSDLNSVFLKNSTEAIWQLKPVAPGRNTNEGQALITGFYSLTSQLVNSFEPGDKRRTAWVTNIANGAGNLFYSYKYKIKAQGQPLNEYSMVLRVAEQLLIRAEARAQQNNIVGALADLNTIRNRAGLTNVLENDKAALLLAIERERRNELFTEWGHRWFDLKRTRRANIILGQIKPNWKATATLYPIPQSEIDVNRNLLPQNDGY